MHIPGEDTQEFDRREILKIRKQRQDDQGHTVYGSIAVILSLAAAAAAAPTIHKIRDNPTTIATLGNMGQLALAVTLGLAAVAATLTWMVVRNQKCLAAQNDLLADDRDQRRLHELRAQIDAALAEHSRTERLKRFNDLFAAAEGTTGRAAPRPRDDDRPPGERTQVIHLGDRTRRTST